jgi:hypothetical protein
MSDAAGTGACHDCFCADPTQCIDHVAAAPEQRQGRGNHAGAQYSEKRNNAVDRIGQLHRHDGVSRQTKRPQACRDRRNCVIGLRVTQGAGRAVRETLAVRRVNKRCGIGVTHPGTAKEIIKRCGDAGCPVDFAEDHRERLKA